jgi:arylsulfatase A-like enzyme
MNARSGLAVAGCATLALASAAGCGGGEDDGGGEPPNSRAGTPPNFVVVMTDDQDQASARRMPRVRRLLAERGTTFDNSFASLPLCCPSRATFVTGQYAHNHGVWDNKPPTGGYPAFTGRERTLGVWLEAAGYRTAWIGKYLNGYGLDGDPRAPPGWTRWFSPMGLDSLLMYDYTVSDDGRVRHYGNRPSDYQTDVLAHEALRFLRDAPGSRRFFLVLAPLAPHDEGDTLSLGVRDPRPAPRHRGAVALAPVPDSPDFDEARIEDKPRKLRRPRLSSTERRDLARLIRDRRASLLAVDEAVGRIVRTLRRQGELARTVVIFTSDNGYLLGEHRLIGGKSLPYRGIAGVPLIVRGPGFESDQHVDSVVGNIDLAPTIVELAGLDPDRILDGVSLTAQPDERRALLLESEAYVSVRTRRFLYVEHDGGVVELYDLRRDPLELENVAGDSRYGTWEDRLAAAAADLRDCAGEECGVTVGPE